MILTPWSDRATGIDIHWLRPPIWEEAAAEFVFLKATEGLSWVDKEYNTRAMIAKADGLVVGAYHWFDTELARSPERQAENFISTVLAHAPDLIAVDFERYDNPRTGREVEWLRRFCVAVREAFPGTPFYIYTNRASWVERMYTFSTVYRNGFGWIDELGLGLWIAAWNGWGRDPEGLKPWGDDGHDFHQYEVGSVGGEMIDQNVFAGTIQDLYSLVGRDPEPPGGLVVGGGEEAIELTLAQFNEILSAEYSKGWNAGAKASQLSIETNVIGKSQRAEGPTG